jgi:hypothetical protein
MLSVMRGGSTAARHSWAIAVVLAVGACAGAPPRPAAPAQPAAQQVEARQRLAAAETLCQQLAGDPQLAPLRGRLMAPEPRQPWTREMMIDTSRVNERDRTLLVLMDEKRAYCRQALLSASPAQTVPLFDYWHRQDTALVRLFNRETTIGDYNRAMADATAQFSIDVTNMQADIAARANRAVVDAPMTTPRGDAGDVPVERFRALQAR